MMKKYKLIKDYPGLIKAGGVAEWNIVYKRYIISGDFENTYKFKKEDVENNPEFWKEIDERDYEILISDGIFHIGSVKCPVKRLSDGKVFNIGDKVKISFDKSHYNDAYACSSQNNKSGTITDTQISSDKHKLQHHDTAPDGIYFRIDNGYWIPIHYVQPVKQINPLFTTQDGVNIYHGYNDDLFFIDSQYQIKSAYYNSDMILRGGVKVFKSKKAAENWVEYNKPKYSQKYVNKMCPCNGGQFKID